MFADVPWRGIWRSIGAMLVFRPAKIDLERHGTAYLAIGLLLTWIAGVGRHWDNRRVGALVHWGFDSVAYVFVLALILWLVILPLQPRNWSYRAVLTFVTLTAPPAFLYALPSLVLPSHSVVVAKTGLLAVVSLWRVALLAVFLSRAARLKGLRLIVALLLPLALIVTALSLLNLDKAVFDFMGGREQPTSDDGAYAVLVLLSIVSVWSCAVLVPIYLVLMCMPARKKPPRP